MNKSKILALFIISLMLLEVVSVNGAILSNAPPSPVAGLGQQTASTSNQTKGDFICSNVNGKVFVDSKRNITTKANLISLTGGSVCYLFGKKLLVSENVMLNYTAPPATLTLYGKNSKLEYYGVNITNTGSNITIIGSKLSGSKFGLDCVTVNNTAKCALVTSRVDLLDYIVARLKKAIREGDSDLVKQLIDNDSDVIKKAILAGITTEEINKIIMDREEESVLLLKKEYEEFKATVDPNSPAGKVALRKKAEEIFAKDKFLSSYLQQQNDLFPQLKLAQRVGDESAALILKDRLVALEIETAKRKNAITGEKDPSLVLDEIFKQSNEYNSLEQEQSFWVRNIRKLTLIGGLMSRVAFVDKNNNGMNDLEELNKMEKDMGESNSKWEDSFFTKTMQGDISVIRYNPETRNFDGLDQVLLYQEERAIRYGTEKAVEIAIVAASAGTGALFSKGATSLINMGIKKYALSEGTGIIMARYALSEGMNAAVFHSTNNVLTSLQKDIPLGEMDWSAGAFVNSFITLETYKYLGQATGKLVNKLPTTSLAGTAAKSSVLTLPLETAVFTGIDLADEFAKGNINNIQDFQGYAKDSVIENGILLAGLKIKEIPTIPKIPGIEKSSMAQRLIERFPVVAKFPLISEIPGIEARTKSAKAEEYKKTAAELKDYNLEGLNLFNKLYENADSGKKIEQNDVKTLLDLNKKAIEANQQLILINNQLGTYSKAEYQAYSDSLNVNLKTVEVLRAEFNTRVNAGETSLISRAEMEKLNPTLAGLKGELLTARKEKLAAEKKTAKDLLNLERLDRVDERLKKEETELNQRNSEAKKFQQRVQEEKLKENRIIAAKKKAGIELTRDEQMADAFYSFSKEDFEVAKNVLAKINSADPKFKLLQGEALYLQGKKDFENGDIAKGKKEYQEAINYYNQYRTQSKNKESSEELVVLTNSAKIHKALGNDKAAARSIKALSNLEGVSREAAEAIKEQIFLEPLLPRLNLKTQESPGADIFTFVESQMKKGTPEGYESATNTLTELSKSGSAEMKIRAQELLKIAEKTKPLSLKEVDTTQIELIKQNLEKSRNEIAQEVLDLKEAGSSLSDAEIKSKLENSYINEWVENYAPVFRELISEPGMRVDVRDSSTNKQLLEKIQTRLKDTFEENARLLDIGKQFYEISQASLSKDPLTAAESYNLLRDLTKSHPELLTKDKSGYSKLEYDLGYKLELETLNSKIINSLVEKGLYDNAILETKRLAATMNLATAEGRAQREILDKNIKTYTSQKEIVSMVREKIKIEKFMKDLESPDRVSREKAAEGLGTVELTDSVERTLIQAATLDKETSVRVYAINSLGELKSENALTALSNLIYEPNSKIVEAASTAMFKINEEITKQLSSTKLLKEFSTLQLEGSLSTEVLEAADADTKGTAAILRGGRLFGILEQHKKDDELRIIENEIKGIVENPTPEILDILLKLKRGEIKSSQAGTDLLKAIMNLGFSETDAKQKTSQIAERTLLSIKLRNAEMLSNKNAEDFLLSIGDLNTAFSDPITISKIRKLSNDAESKRVLTFQKRGKELDAIAMSEFEAAKLEFRNYITQKIMSDFPDSANSNRLWAALLTQDPRGTDKSVQDYLKSGGNLQEIESFKKRIAQQILEVENQLSQNVETFYTEKDWDLIYHDLKGMRTVLDTKLQLLSIYIEMQEGKPKTSLPVVDRLTQEGGKPVELKTITSARGVQDTLYSNIVGKNFNELFSYQISPDIPNIKGSKAVAYIDSNGNVKIAFWGKTDSIHHAEILGNFIGGVEGKEIIGQNFDSPSLRNLLGKMQGFQLQYDSRSGKIIGIQMDSSITKFQADNRITIKQSDLDKLKKSILDSIDPRLKKEGLTVETVGKLLIIR